MTRYKVGSWDDVTWVEKCSFERTWTVHIWKCVETGLYHFSDEASQFDIWGYETIEDCQEALDLYCDQLNGK